MNKIDLERLITERKDEARKKQIAQKADLLVMEFGDTTSWYDGEYGNDTIPTAAAFQYHGLKIKTHFVFSRSIEICYGKDPVFFATYEPPSGFERRPGEQLKHERGMASASLSPLQVSVKIHKYLQGEWEERLEAYARDPARLEGSYMRERKKRLDMEFKKEWDERNKPKMPADPAKAEATEGDIKRAMDNFGIGGYKAEFMEYPPEVRRHLEFLEKCAKRIGNWPAWRRAGIVPMYDEKEETK